MNKHKRELIEAVAEIIRAECSIPCPVKNIQALVESLGGKLSLIQDPTLINGRIYKCIDEDYQFCIEVNKDIPEYKRNLLIACSLGHLFLHMGYMYDSEKWNKQETYLPYQEYLDVERRYEATEFAYALLMPKKEVTRYVGILDGSEINLIEAANHFNVSSLMILNRCKSLELV